MPNQATPRKCHEDPPVPRVSEKPFQALPNLATAGRRLRREAGCLSRRRPATDFAERQVSYLGEGGLSSGLCGDGFP